jgi:dephospho-CoA kinase
MLKGAGNISIIGITGTVSSGKSTVADFLKKSGGNLMVIDVDKTAKGLYEKYPEIKLKVKRVFGDNIFDKENNIIFKSLAEKVFSKEEDLMKLNRIMFPCIRKEIKNIIKSAGDYEHVIIDAAVLFGAKLDILCDYIILVDSDREKREKLLKNRGLSDKEARLIIKGQHIKINDGRVDYIIINDGDKKKLYEKACSIMNNIDNKKSKDAKE